MGNPVEQYKDQWLTQTWYNGKRKLVDRGRGGWLFGQMKDQWMKQQKTGKGKMEQMDGGHERWWCQPDLKPDQTEPHTAGFCLNWPVHIWED